LGWMVKISFLPKGFESHEKKSNWLEVESVERRYQKNYFNEKGIVLFNIKFQISTVLKLFYLLH
jgi:hypothetical protein